MSTQPKPGTQPAPAIFLCIVAMSGLEIAGVLLGAFPLIVTSVEHWRDVAKVGGYFWRVKQEYIACRREVQFHELLYKRNLKELLLPILHDVGDMTQLLSDPGGKGWSEEGLQDRLTNRLQESYALYMEIVNEMNEAAQKLKQELVIDKTPIQNRLAPAKPQQPPALAPQSRPSKFASAKDKWDYETFRISFSFGEPVRRELFGRLKECNERLEKLLSTSDKLSALENAAPTATKHSHTLESTFKKVWRTSDLLYRAIQNAWQCTCLQHHHANLRLEHRKSSEACFDIILTPGNHSSQSIPAWSWKGLQCKQPVSCCDPQQKLHPVPLSQSSQNPNNSTSTRSSLITLTKRKQVVFRTPAATTPSIQLSGSRSLDIRLCHALGTAHHDQCLGTISHDDETFHLHPAKLQNAPGTSEPLTLDRILSGDVSDQMTRRQRYTIALLLASSVAQLHPTPWLNPALTKDDILFFPSLNDTSYHKPFIRQGFKPTQPNTIPAINDTTFASLGILLLELCYGRRLEDYAFRKKYEPSTGDTKDAFDLMAALKWSQGLSEEGGPEYAAAVKWCFFAGTGTGSGSNSWRGEIIKNVIRPLEKCQEFFEGVGVV
ncbi:hypothetical protein BKA63DRAFT_32446 [Paraphoma chrysanthemicola]|nr:hypothetical protein BKA63DRAFT_32446 [Paraphoma chrysanthemicola]